MIREEEDVTWRTWTTLIGRGLFYLVAIVLMFPFLVLFRADPRIDYAEDLAFGCEEMG